MALDIAPAPPKASPALPPGANAPPPNGGHDQAFATMLAKSVQIKAASPAATSGAAAETTGPAPQSKKGKDDKDNSDTLLALQAPNITPLVPPPPPAPPGALALNTPETPAATAQEAMDTRPVLPPAPPGGAVTKTGGELLPQTAQPDTSALAQAAAANVGTSANEKTPSLRGKNALQIGAKPANNTGIALKEQAASNTTSRDFKLAIEDVLSRSAEEPQKAKVASNGVNDLQGSLTALVMPQTVKTDTSASVAPLPEASHAALVSQASEAVQSVRVQASASGQGQMTLQLHPHDWGKLQVSVTITPTGGPGGGTTVTAHLVAESHAVRTALEGQASELKQALTDAGMKLENLTVTVRGVEAGAEAQGSNTDPQANQPKTADAWAQQQTSGQNTGGGASFSSSGGNGFYAPPGTRGTMLSDDTDAETTFVTTTKPIAQGIDVRA